jgi:hypothetical protein
MQSLVMTSVRDAYGSSPTPAIHKPFATIDRCGGQVDLAKIGGQGGSAGGRPQAGFGQAGRSILPLLFL